MSPGGVVISLIVLGFAAGISGGSFQCGLIGAAVMAAVYVPIFILGKRK